MQRAPTRIQPSLKQTNGHRLSPRMPPRTAGEKWTTPIQYWKPVLNHFMIEFEEQLVPHAQTGQLYSLFAPSSSFSMSIGSTMHVMV